MTTDEVQMNFEPHDGGLTPEFVITFTVRTTDADRWQYMWDILNTVAEKGRLAYLSVSMASQVLDDDVDDERTRNRVIEALVDSGLNPQQVTVAMNQFRNAGIVFRDRT